jgi:hypothetical protein
MDTERPMHFTLNPEQADPHDVLIAEADKELANAREQITLADEQIAHVHKQLFKLEHDAARRPSDPQYSRKRFHSVPSDRPWLRGLIVLLLATVICVAAIARSYGNAARLILAQWVPQFASTSSLSLENLAPTQASQSIVQVAAAEPLTPQPTPSAPVMPQDVAPTAVSISPELKQLLQTMARDLANVEQGIEQLKAGQEQMASDNAKALEQLKDNQEQMARVVAKASEQNLKPSAPPPRPIVTLTRKPVSTLQSPQTTAQSQAETRPQARMRPQAEEPQPPLAQRPPMLGH